MRDGIDRGAFKAELRTLDAGERRRRQRQFGAWLRAAARSDTPHAYTALAITGLPLIAILGRVFVFTGSRALLVAGLVILSCGQWLNWRSSKRVHQWRERHPFEQWRSHHYSREL